MDRFIETWMAIPKWWKTFYIAFPILVVVLLRAIPDPGFALPIAFLWSSMIALGMWASEKLKERMRSKRNYRDDRGRRR